MPSGEISPGLSPWEPGLLSLGLYTFLVFGLLAVLLFLTGWLGDRKPGPEKGLPYECGIVPTGSGRVRYPVPFYLVAVFFLIFDVEGAFIFAWAVAYDRLGFRGWLEVTFFIGVLLASLAYIWRKGGLEWGPTASRTPPS